jgi:hypothetical protein
MSCIVIAASHVCNFDHIALTFQQPELYDQKDRFATPNLDTL